MRLISHTKTKSMIRINACVKSETQHRIKYCGSQLCEKRTRDFYFGRFGNDIAIKAMRASHKQNN